MTAVPDPTATFPRRAAAGVQLLSVLLVLVEVGRLAFTGDSTTVAIGAVAAALVLPLHAQHLRYGLQGLRPPRAGVTLGAMAAVHVAALALVGQDWAFMLATLATSALVVLRPPWSIAALGACCAAPLVASLWLPDPSLVGTPAYLAYAILFRSVIQFALVWLVAAAHRLAVARAALAAEAVAQERARVETQVRAAVEQRLQLLAGTAGTARRALDGPDVALPMVALDRVLALAADALADLRRIVAGHRDASGAADPASVLAPGEGPTGGAARRFCVLVHAVVLPFPLLAALGLLGESPATLAIVLVAWPLLVALELRLAAGTARGEGPAGPRTRWLAAVAVATSGLVLVAGDSWVTASWLSAAIALLAFSGRGRAIALAVVALVAAGTIVAAPLPAFGLFGVVAANAWYVAYVVVLDVLAVGGLYGSARLVAQVDELETTRAALARGAVDAERRRLSGDLHDVLGQSLTALSLKADLARRLVPADRARAAAEIDGLLRLATDQAAEVAAVTRGERTVELAVEVREAVALLEAAGARVTCDVRLDDVDPASGALLGWVVREGATNVLRHARPRHCTLRIGARADAIALELTNDGAAAPGPGGDGTGNGTGLRGLDARLGHAGGCLWTGRDPDGTFRLHAELPALVTA